MIWQVNVFNILSASFQLNSMSIFEALMLLCFGASWPFALVKTYKTKVVQGKSIRFLVLILIGYVCGIIHKVLYNIDIVVWLYFINFVMISTDLILTLIYKNRDIKKNEIIC